MFQQVYTLAEDVFQRTSYVDMHEPSIDRLAEKIKAWRSNVQPPAEPMPFDLAFAAKTLVRSAINYCYWYGQHDIRPGGACALLMYKIVSERMDAEVERTKGKLAEPLGINALDSIIESLAVAGFPMMEHRSRHIRELVQMPLTLGLLPLECVLQDTRSAVSGRVSIEELANTIVRYLPGFAQDPFRKRVCLYLMELYRERGWFADQIGLVPVPADYQIPKMLRHFGVLEYEHMLGLKVDNSVPLFQGCGEEVAIRAATIWACKRIAEVAGVTTADVDFYLWQARKESAAPFHLTVTTDY